MGTVGALGDFVQPHYLLVQDEKLARTKKATRTCLKVAAAVLHTMGRDLLLLKIRKSKLSNMHTPSCKTEHTRGDVL